MKKTVLLLLISLISLWAHGVGSKVVDNSETVSLYFYYSDGSALSYGAVKVFGPSDGDIEFQNGRSDRTGGFSFRPNEIGLWLVEVKDSKDHVGTIKIMVQKEKEKFTHTVFK